MGVDFVIEYDYQPAEPMRMYYPDGSGYPGCDEEFNITRILIGNVDVTDLCYEHDIVEQLINKLKT